MPIQLMSLLAPCPCKILSYLRKLGPWCRKDLGAPQLILWTSWPSPLTFNPTLRVLQSPSFHLSLLLVPRELIFLHSFPVTSLLSSPTCMSLRQLFLSLRFCDLSLVSGSLAPLLFRIFGPKSFGGLFLRPSRSIFWHLKALKVLF